MTIPRDAVIDLRAPSQRAAGVERAAAILRDGGLVVLPTETVYGVGASAASESALARVWAVKGSDPGGREGWRTPLAWHLPSTEALLEALARGGAGTAPAHRRLIRKLTPGPVTFAVPMEDRGLREVRGWAGAVAGAFDDGRELLARVPRHAMVQALLARAERPIVVGSLGPARHLARSADEAVAALGRSDAAGEPSVDLVLDDGATALGKQSTLVRLGPGGGFEVLREGAYEERFIRKQMTRTVLFVCTGNTCRSPMAAAIAAHLVRQGPVGSVGTGGMRTLARSAGTSAGPGLPATDESGAALQRLGIEMPPHLSMPLTRELLNEADVIFAMTRAHADEARRLDPSAADRIRLLDPDGHDIPDPIGQGQEVYDRTARAIREAVERRLATLED